MNCLTLETTVVDAEIKGKKFFGQILHFIMSDKINTKYVLEGNL